MKFRQQVANLQINRRVRQALGSRVFLVLLTAIISGYLGCSVSRPRPEAELVPFSIAFAMLEGEDIEPADKPFLGNLDDAKVEWKGGGPVYYESRDEEGRRQGWTIAAKYHRPYIDSRGFPQFLDPTGAAFFPTTNWMAFTSNGRSLACFRLSAVYGKVESLIWVGLRLMKVEMSSAISELR